MLSSGPMGQLGTYGAASRFGSYTTVPLKGQALAFYPSYFELAEQKRYAQLRHILRRNSLRGFWLGFAVMLTSVGVVAALSTTLLREYGNPLIVLSAILALATPFRAAQYAYGDVLYALGKPSVRLAIAAITVLASLSFVALGVYTAGALGAAIGSVIGVVFGTLLLRWIARRIMSGRHRRS
jgi:O-antigen/teichoic acid export membrane protein